MKKVLIYGDSNVWGDNFITGTRIDLKKQWANILQKKLYNNYLIIQEGLPGRVAGLDDVKKFKNGKDTFLSIFRTSAPVDIVVIALGTNDLQIKYNKSADKIIEDLLWYKKIIEEEFEDSDNRKKYFINFKLPQIIYILPPEFDYKESAKEIFDFKSEEKRSLISNYFVKNYKDIIILPNKISLFEDGIHLDYEGHREMASLVERKILDNE